ncbi:hypothetical protein ASD01_21980 [Ensifer sp. Root423]|nr:hypothetical protein ASD01_21980 [Ensifer sp. Root423]
MRSLDVITSPADMSAGLVLYREQLLDEERWFCFEMANNGGQRTKKSVMQQKGRAKPDLSWSHHANASTVNGNVTCAFNIAVHSEILIAVPVLPPPAKAI